MGVQNGPKLTDVINEQPLTWKWMDGNLGYGLVLFGMGRVDGWLVFVLQPTVSKGSFKKTKKI